MVDEKENKPSDTEKVKAQQEAKEKENKPSFLRRWGESLYRNRNPKIQQPSIIYSRPARERLNSERSSSTSSSSSSIEMNKSISLIIFILGVLHYFLAVSSLGSSTSKYILSLVLFVLSGYALTNKLEKYKSAIMIPMFAFVVWYFFFGGRYDLGFIIPAVITLIVLSLVLGLFTKGETVKPELVGLLPAIVLWLDAGLISFLTQQLNLSITPLLEILILFMPWWAIFGLMTLPSDASQNPKLNFIINLVRVVGILYLVIILMTAFTPNIGYSKEQLPTLGDFEESKSKIVKEIGDKENPAWSNLICLLTRTTEVSICVEERQEASRLSVLCINSGYKEGSIAYENCLKKEAENEKQKSTASGNIASYLLPTKVEFKESNYFPKSFYRKSFETTIKYPIEFKIENPRGLNLVFEFSCDFTAKNNLQTDYLPGEITITGEGNVESFRLETNEKIDSRTIICQPKEETSETHLNGSYKLNYTVKIVEMSTVSLLKRAFIGNKNETWKTENVPKILSAHFTGKTDESQYPAEFARIRFALGNPSIDNPLVNGEGDVFLVSNIEDSGVGKLIQVHSFNLNFPSFSILSNEEECLRGTFAIPNTENKAKNVFQLSACQLSLPEKLQNPEDYFIETFEAELVYDYLLKKEISVEVKNEE